MKIKKNKKNSGKKPGMMMPEKEAKKMMLKNKMNMVAKKMMMR